MKSQVSRERLTACITRCKYLPNETEWIERLEPRRLLSSGALDPTFGQGGKVIADPRATLSGFADACAVEPDGRILVAGSASNLTGGSSAAIACFNADGSVDTTFGVNGTVDYMSPTGLRDEFTCVVVEANGDILAGGTSTAGDLSSTFLLARFNADGSLDASFGNGGVVITTFSDGSGQMSCLAIRRDGVIVAAGVDIPKNNSYLALAYYNPDGSLDSLIGNGGIVESKVPATSGAFYEGNTMATMGNKIIVTAANGATTVAGVVRFTRSGRLDKTFGDGGIANRFLPFGYGAFGLSVGADDEILVGVLGLGSSIGVAALTSAGQLNRSFGNNGLGLFKPTFDTSGPFTHSGPFMTVQSDGDIIIADNAGDNPSNLALALFGFNSQGKIDGLFGSGGSETYIPGNPLEYMAIIAQSDGKLLVPVIPSPYSAAPEIPEGLEILRFTADGQTDTSFGADGQASATLTGPGDNSFDDVAEASDGDIYALLTESGTPAGSYQYIPNEYLVRYTPDGTLDTTFGTNGQVAVPYGTSAVAVQSDGKIVVGGITSGPPYFDATITRYNSDGSIDSSFGNAGTFEEQVDAGLEIGFNLPRLLVQPDGTILAMIGGSISEFLHLSAGGQLIGTSIIGQDAGYYSSNGLSDLAVASDDKLVVVDSYSNFLYGPSELIVEQFNADLTPDTSFGTDGQATPLLNYSDGDYTLGSAVAIEPDGTIVVAAQSYSGGHVLIGLTSTGALDPTFGNDGIVRTSMAINSLLIESDGKILADGAAGSNLVMMRFNDDGTGDPTFGSHGRLLTRFGGAVTAGRMILDPDGTVLVIGDADTGKSNLYAPATEAFMARFDVDPTAM